MKAVRAFETSSTNYTITRYNNPDDPILQYENGFATNKIFHF
jgi:hypothetical protein